LPRTLGDAAVLAIVDGVAEAGDAFSSPVVGGNISRNRASITTTVIGRAEGSTRAGARMSDGVYVTGPLGAAALG
jgi:thiamine monophosphate kinase